MSWNDRFFRTFWPQVGPAFTANRAQTNQEIRSLFRLVRLPAGARILDVPCGFGRHAVALARRGFRVTGVDISSDLLAQARETAASKGVSVEFRQADMRRMAYRQRFDAVLNLFTSFGYYGDAEDLQVLKGFHRALRPGGWLVLDVLNRDWLVRHFEPRERLQEGNFVVSQKRSFDFATSVLTLEWTARRGRVRMEGTCRVRHYSCHELVGLLGQAGFSRVRPFGGLNGKPLSFDSRRLVLTARR